MRIKYYISEKNLITRELHHKFTRSRNFKIANSNILHEKVVILWEYHCKFMRIKCHILQIYKEIVSILRE